MTSKQVDHGRTKRSYAPENNRQELERNGTGEMTRCSLEERCETSGKSLQ